MAKIDPRIAQLAQTLQSRLELERSLGHSVVSLTRVPADQVLPCAASAASAQTAWPGADTAAQSAATVQAPPAQTRPSASATAPTQTTAQPTEVSTPLAQEVPSAAPAPQVSPQEPVAPVSPDNSSSDVPAPSIPTETEIPEEFPAFAQEESTADSPETRRERLAPVEAEALSCTRCRLHETRNHVVFGEGPLTARLMFVGEGPGAEEDKQGRPFVGRAGEMLTRMIENVLELTRDDVYITNIIKCRPPGNRNPQPDEVNLCHSYLTAQIKTIRPAVIVTLGRPAVNTMLDNMMPMGKVRGSWFEYQGIPLMPIYHPAYLLRQRDQEGRATKADRLTLGDLLLVKERLKRHRS